MNGHLAAKRNRGERMSELRRNPFTGEWTLCAENRKNRPYEFLHKTEVKAKGSEGCPFCSGHEEKTTAPLYQDGDDDSWQIRVFPNMFPAVSKEAKALAQNSFYELISGKGQHEVLVDTPHHEVTIDQFSAERLAKIFAVLQQRYCKMMAEEDVKFIQIFKNCGPSAGMSIRHSHWQILGLPMVPQREELMRGHMQQGDCLFCKMLQFEKEQDLRIVTWKIMIFWRSLLMPQDFLMNFGFALKGTYQLLPMWQRVSWKNWLCCCKKFCRRFVC